MNELRRPKEKRSEEIILLLSTHNSNNSDISPIIRKKFGNFHHSKKMSNASVSTKLTNSICQSPNVEGLLCKSKFMLVEEHF